MDGRKTRFIIKLAEFLVANQAGKSIALSMESDRSPVKWASEWAALRNETPLRGYPTVEEAVETLKEFLG